MASRLFQFNYTYERDMVTIHAKVAIGASGAPTLNTTLSKGIVSITRNSAGQYTLVMKDQMNKLMSVEACVLSSTGISASPNVGVKTDNVNGTTPSVTIVCSTGGTATDPGSGETLLLTIHCRQAST